MFSRVWPGRPYPLGATWDGIGVNFALFSENATKVELCLFDSAEARAESSRIAVPWVTNQVWHCHLPDAKPGLLYGYRVHGPYAPWEGHRFNAHKIVLDPYAKAIGRDLQWDDALYGFRRGAGNATDFDERDSAPFAPLACVMETAFTWGEDRPPRTPWHDTVVYETHVKGFTRRHPSVPEELRGTYAGLASPVAIGHLRDLGVTAVELLPIHYHINDHFLVEKGLVNYWGYNTLGYFAPDPRYASGGPRWAVQEFKSMVRTLHSEGLEVILDVVYNHTAEGDHLGPTLSLRGIDNAAYYRLAEDRSRYVDFTGCGNSLDCAHPHALQLIMDSLNLKDLYWLTPNGTEMADADWNADHARCLGMGLMGEQIDETDEHGQRITGDSFLILFNVDHESVLFRLGGRARGLNWELMFDTSGPDLKSRCLKRLDDYLLQGRTIAVLRPELPSSAQTMNLGI